VDHIYDWVLLLEDNTWNIWEWSKRSIVICLLKSNDKKKSYGLYTLD
jgi:hypothetical protein